MKTRYQTLDGEMFDEAADAGIHEEVILSYVQMWDRQGNITFDTNTAVLLHLSENVLAGKIFKKMVEANEIDVLGEDIEHMFNDEDSGWFYWDEYTETYRYLDISIVNIIASVIKENSALSKN